MDPSDQINHLMRISRRATQKAEFDTLERSALLRMGDKELAVWQAQFTADQPQWLLAEHEWQRRLTAQQIRASHITAWVGVVGTLAGVFFGWWLSSLQHRSAPQVQAQSHAAGQPAVQQPVATPPQATTPATPAPVQKPLNPNP